jgi:hypothetical protein
MILYLLGVEFTQPGTSNMRADFLPPNHHLSGDVSHFQSFLGIVAYRDLRA